MKCRDCENLIWSYAEGERIWQCRERYCPDLDIERDCPDFAPQKPDIFTAFSTLQAENEKLRVELEQVKRCIKIIEKQRDAAIKELENYMVQDVLDGNEPCGICAKASDIPCEYCNPKWSGPKED